MEKNIASFKEHQIRKATDLPVTTLNKNHKAAQKSEEQSIGDRKRAFLQDWLISFPLWWYSLDDCTWGTLLTVDELDSVQNFLEGRGNYFSEKKIFQFIKNKNGHFCVVFEAFERIL